MFFSLTMKSAQNTSYSIMEGLYNSPLGLVSHTFGRQSLMGCSFILRLRYIYRPALAGNVVFWGREFILKIMVELSFVPFPRQDIASRECVKSQAMIFITSVQQARGLAIQIWGRSVINHVYSMLQLILVALCIV